MCLFFKELKPKQGSESRLLVYDELLQLGGDNVNICWWDFAAWVRLQKCGIWIKKKKKKALVSVLPQSQVTAALKLLITVTSPGKLALPEWLQSTTELSPWPAFVYLVLSRYSVYFTCFVIGLSFRAWKIDPSVCVILPP